MVNQVHIISFDIPFPANYGGVIDVYYKVRALHGAGIKVHLHCFEYQRAQANELEKICASVHYYPRNMSLKANLGIRPFIVQSRISGQLLDNLLKDNHPVLFEGLHTCGIIGEPGLKNRLLIYRESNIEHHYYYHLFLAERNLPRKGYFLMESLRLFLYQSVLRHASVMLTVSTEDADYLKKHFPENRVEFLPSFHGHFEVKSRPGRGKYALYQGKLSVSENSQAAKFLIEEVWEERFPELIIAGHEPPAWLRKMTMHRKNIRLIENPADTEMFKLINEAHINLMVTFQATGLKLKLLNALYNGRFCLVNPAMVKGTSLGELCESGSTADELKQAVARLFREEFTETMINKRRNILLENYSDQKNCKRLIDLLTLRS